MSSGPRRAHSGSSSSRRVSSPGISSIVLASDAREQHSLTSQPASAGWLALHGVPLATGREQVSKLGMFNAPGLSSFPEGRQQEQPRDTHSLSPSMPQQKGCGIALSSSASTQNNPSSDIPHPSQSTDAFVPTLEKPGAAASTSRNPSPEQIIQTSSPLNHQSSTTPPPTAMSSSDTRSLIHPHATSSTSGTSPPLTTTSPSNHADSPVMALQPPSAPEHSHPHHCMQSVDTPTTGVSPIMPPLTNEHQRLEPRASLQAGYASGSNSPARKRGYPASATTADDLNQRQPTYENLPFGLRNKKMKATDCLLYAATLLSKDDSSVPADVHPRTERHRSSSSEMTAPAPNNADVASEKSAEDLAKPREYDVLCGRGGLINKHVGNVVYRKVVEHNKSYYQSVHKKHRILVSQSIVQSISKFGGRFLIHGTKSKSWIEIGYKKAVQKTSQALRERTPPQDEEGVEEEDTESK